MTNGCPICFRTYTAGLWDHMEKCAKKRAKEETRRDAQEDEDRRRAHRKAEGFED